MLSVTLISNDAVIVSLLLRGDDYVIDNLSFAIEIDSKRTRLRRIPVIFILNCSTLFITRFTSPFI